MREEEGVFREVWASRVRNLARNYARITFFRVRNFTRNSALIIWASDLQYPNISHKFPACLLPKIPGLSCHGLFPFSMGRTRTPERIGARSATKLQHNIQWDKEECASRTSSCEMTLSKTIQGGRDRGSLNLQNKISSQFLSPLAQP